MRYFNAGVMLWNVDRLREEYSFERFMDAAGELGFDLQYADQEILNYLLYDKIFYCDGDKYNYIVRGEVQQLDLSSDEAIIMHYAGCNPWQDGLKNDLYRIWWEYAKKTPFYLELLEENLWREMGIGEKKNAETLRDMESREIYEYSFLLKGSTRVKKELEKNHEKIGIYGTGVMGETLYRLLESDGVWKKISVVADKNRTDDFHTVKVISDISDCDNTMWIVTPVFRSKQVVSEVKSQMGKNCKAVAFRDWLKNIS